MTNNIVVENNRPLLYTLYLLVTVYCIVFSTRGFPDSSQLLTGNACCDSHVCFGPENHSDLNGLFTSELVLYYKSVIDSFTKLFLYHSHCKELNPHKFYFSRYRNTTNCPYTISHLRKIRSVVLLN
jgi:hypothetical protein